MATLQEVTTAGNITTNPIIVNPISNRYGIDVNAIGTGDGITVSAINGIGIVSQSNNIGIFTSGGNIAIQASGNTGIYASGNIAVHAYSDSGKAGVFSIPTSNVSNIVEFKKNNVNQAYITHNGSIVANSFVKTGGTSDQILLANGSTSSLSEKISKITIAQIRALTGTLPNNNLYTTDLGQEGNWYYDATDTTSVDNTGSIIVTADGKRVKRVIVGGEYYTSWFGAKADGTNEYSILQNMLNSLKLESKVKKVIFNKGNTGTYTVGSTLLFSLSNVTWDFRANIKTTMTVNPITVCFSDQLGESPIVNIYNVRIEGNGNYFDGNGNLSTSTGVFVPAATMQLTGVIGFEINNVTSKNGLFHDCVIFKSQNGKINNCDFKDSRGYNGLTVYGTPANITYIENDASTWNNIIVTGCSASNCSDYGFTSQEAINVTFENCLVYNSSMGYSSEAHTSINLRMRTNFLNCKAEKLTGPKGFSLQSNDIYMDENCGVANITNSLAITSGDYRIGGGMAVWVIGKNNITVQGVFKNLSGWGISQLKVSDIAFTNNLTIKNVIIQDSLIGGISMYGLGENAILNNVYIDGVVDNSIAGQGIIVYNGSSVFNLNAGSLKINNTTIKNTSGKGIQSDGLKNIEINNIYGYNNLRRVGEVGAAFQVSAGSITTGSFFKIRGFKADKISSVTTLGFKVSSFDKSDILDFTNDYSTILDDDSVVRVNQNVGTGLIIGGTSLNASAILQADSVTKGFLPPRMTTTQKNAITSPSGLVVYDITLNKLCVRGASNWETITST